MDTNIPYNPNPPSRCVVLTGQRFTRLTVIAFWAVHKQASFWLCRCDCGVWKVVGANKLRQDTTRSCGCMAREALAARSTKHGAKTRSRTSPEYEAYRGMRKRCNNENSRDYPDYGGRGIECHFASFTDFLAEVGMKPTPKHSLDRINTDGHYEVGNVRWSTAVEQANNKRNNRMLTFNGETKTLPEWSRSVGLNPSMVAKA